MPVTRLRILIILAITSFYLLGQLLAGTDAAVAFTFAAAIFFGVLSVFAGGGLTSAFGCLNAILVGKFLLFGIGLKIMLLEPADRTLNSPLTTASVMAIGFAGVFSGTLIQSYFSSPESLSMNRPFSNRMFLSLSFLLFVLGNVGYFAAMIPSVSGEGIQTGGWLGVARAFGELKSLSIVPPMLYLWRINTRRWMTHPVVLCILFWSALVGIFSTNKQDALEPWAFYLFVGFLRYGWRDVRLWSIVSVGAVYYALLVFPYSQYVRHHGGREGTFEHRLETTKEAFWRIASDRDFRSMITDRVSKTSFFEQPQLAPFDRLAMIGEADKLISATERQKAFTGWETITWGFRLMMPSLLYPDKPVFEAGNYLAHIVGEVGRSDTTTQVSYGVMANFYNAFSFLGVLVGTPVFFAGFYYWLRIFLGNARCDGLPTTSTLWFIWLIASYQHSIVESSFSGILASTTLPVVVGLLCLAAKYFQLCLRKEA